MRNSAFLFLLLTGWLLACRSGGSPVVAPRGNDSGGGDGTAGLYVLRTLAGDALPVVGNQVATLVVLGDTIRLERNGTGLETGMELVIDATLPEGEAKRHYERPFNYRRIGARIEVEFPCPIDALMICATPPHYVGALTAEGLELSYALYYRTPLVFERIEE